VAEAAAEVPSSTKAKKEGGLSEKIGPPFPLLRKEVDRCGRNS